jgi:hypothetical protein
MKEPSVLRQKIIDCSYNGERNVMYFLHHREIIDYVPTLSRLPVLTCRCNWLEARAATIIDRTLLESIHNMVVRVKAHFLLV